MPASLCLQLLPIASSFNSSANAPIPSSANPQFPLLSSPISSIKVPTPPWMRGPLRLQLTELQNLSKSTKKRSSKPPDPENVDKPLTAKESGVRGRKAMINIVKSVEKLQENQNPVNSPENSEELDLGESLAQLVGDEDGDGDESLSKKLPCEKEEKFVLPKLKKQRVITKAELVLDRDLLRQLRTEAAGMRNWVKVKKAGVTQRVVDEIRCAWRTNELAMVKFDVPLCRNMNRAREILELKTGGLFVWTRKDFLVIYRGSDYHLRKRSFRPNENYPIQFIDGTIDDDDATIAPINGSLFERETDRLLSGLGPRFVDWWMAKPLPVDADLLPEVVPGFMPPSRLCPSISRPKLKMRNLLI